MRSFVYPARLIPEKRSGLTVRFPDLPEAITSGEDRVEALRQAADCLEDAIAGRIADNLEIPNPSNPRRNQTLIALPAPMAAKAALYLAIREAGVSNLQLARRLGLHEKEIRRMLDPRHATRLARVQEVLTALGKRLVVGMDAAA
jgi:antitoxin HicB